MRLCGSRTDSTQAIRTRSRKRRRFSKLGPVDFLGSQQHFKFTGRLGQWLRELNPLRLQYVILRTKSKNRYDSCTYIYVRGLCDRNMGLLPASNRHFTVSPHEVCTCFRSAAGSHFTACLPTEEKWSLFGAVRCFGKFWKITIVGPSSIHRLAWNTSTDANYKTI